MLRGLLVDPAMRAGRGRRGDRGEMELLRQPQAMVAGTEASRQVGSSTFTIRDKSGTDGEVNGEGPQRWESTQGRERRSSVPLLDL